MSLHKKIASGISLILLLAACHKEDGINLFKHVDAEGWQKNDTLVFDIPATEEDADYDLQIQARLTRKYSFADLWLIAEQTYTEDSTMYAITDTISTPPEDSVTIEPPHSLTQTINDTIHIAIADENGNMTGNGKSLLEYKQPIRFVRIKKGTTGAIRIRHIMTPQNIQGIHDIGIELKPLR